ncbi:MAG: zinc ribbon domain-containing protein [Gemmatimonadetes bacterium]|nr:zinc ribbon domain-containing protein [Gemmatimonadota bacterium]
MTDEIVTRLYRCLVEELRSRGHSPEHPIKVSELYQDLVPYRAVRSALGVELNADYEHALLRLLSGERDLLRLEPQQARDELRREVEASYPFVGLFRKFSTSDVWVSPAEADQRIGATDAEAAGGDAPADAAPVPQIGLERGRAGASAAPTASDSPPVRIAAEADGAPPSGTRRGGPLPARAPAPVHLHREDAEADPADRLTHAGSDCVFCGEDLPTGRRIRFCPQCGGDQRLRPCVRCDAVLEREWRYCISCGHEVARD